MLLCSCKLLGSDSYKVSTDSSRLSMEAVKTPIPGGLSLLFSLRINYNFVFLTRHDQRIVGLNDFKFFTQSFCWEAVSVWITM